MATAAVGSEKGSAMERFGGGGMALLPWTKQMLTVLWEQLRLLVQVIYYTFMSVFQMFRFEVHVRITDETGQHIQHMSTASNPTESFLFSSLFDGDNSVMVGSSNFCADVGEAFAGKSTAEALLSSLRAEDLCCGIVDDFVSRTAGEDGSGIFLGHKSSWKMGFPGDWNIFVSSGDSSGSDSRHKSEKESSKGLKRDTSEEERSCHWSSEEDQSVVEFDSEENKALWESLSRSSDPYNPFFFSACITTNSDMGRSKTEVKDGSDTTSEEPRGLGMWVSRSDSESSWSSWTGSDCSGPDVDREESDRLWEFFSSPEDPYNPMCFTASTVSTTKTTESKDQDSSAEPASRPDSEEKDGSSAPSQSEDDEEEQLWRSLCQKNDPYHPLNFQACLQSPTADPSSPPKTSKTSKKTTKPALTERPVQHHCHSDTTQVCWRRPGFASQQATPEPKKTSRDQKKVTFSPEVQVHVMRTWPFACRASRKGHWEELARDRERFRRRIQDTERAIGHCFSPDHRERMWTYVDGALNKNHVPTLNV
ncbi:protein phosphatase 1 regulatory subunit 15A [Sphaeramia orbicularis]|uniref:Protein phosphatase 1 regulatory subunit 15A-like n=1 Tax=Sphaeramia orbicularis TaxID=375764 RepID=A0A673A9R1_9TELE|nr:protein phosphatase 1 regulatory subunit 15A-like [Sphaeramia orbicularis]